MINYVEQLVQYRLTFVKEQVEIQKKEFVYFLYIARGSLQETKYLLILAKDLGYLTIDAYNDLTGKCNLIGRMLNSLIKKIGSNLESKMF